MRKREYVQANREWLRAKAKEDGVVTLPDGVAYRVLAEGDPAGDRPTARSIVTVHYTGRTINGRVFDSTRGVVAMACRLDELIGGWIVALQRMRVGDRWEVYVPAEMGYGKRSLPGIPGGSTLIFEIELVGVA